MTDECPALVYLTASVEQEVIVARMGSELVSRVERRREIWEMR